MSNEFQTEQQSENNAQTESTLAGDNPEINNPGEENSNNPGEGKEPPADNNVNKIYGKPENYDFSSVDIGENMELEPETVKEFSELAGKCNLNQNTANEFVKLGANLINKSIAQIQKQQKESYKIAMNADKEIGGINLNAALDDAEMAYAQFATPELIKYFDETGLRCHPEVIKTFRNIGQMMKEGKIFDGKDPAGGDLTPAQILYGE